MSIRLLGADEKENYLAFRPETPASLVTDRLGSGHLCFAARYQGRIIGATWATTKRAWIDYLDYDLPLRAGEVYTYDGFTLPEYRGHGVAPAISVHMLRYFAEAGYQRATRTILPENSASLRARKKAGYTPVGVMGYMRIGPWTRHFFSKIGSGNSTTAISW
ncbi:MAG: GNAT family N-acetyltransferase [Anaerolineae bacterium]|nr:GNAT family N-acetyltransferase [Gemmatimonadaceae bacterium]